MQSEIIGKGLEEGGDREGGRGMQGERQVGGGGEREMEEANRKRTGMRSKGNERRGQPSNGQVNTVAGVTGTHKLNCITPKTGFCTKSSGSPVTPKERLQLPLVY